MPASYNFIVKNSAISTRYFGELTAAGVAGVDVGTSGLTIVGGNASAHWAAANVSGRTIISPTAAGDTANLNAGPYALVLIDGSTVNLSIVANAKSVGTLAQLKSALQSGLAYGTQVLLREEGSYPDGDAGAQGIVPVYTGTWVEPVNYANAYPAEERKYHYPRGIDPTTGNHVWVHPHPGETVTISEQVTIYETAGTGFCRTRFSDITFSKLDTGLETVATVGMLEIHGGADACVDRCIFQALPSTGYTRYERRYGVKILGRNGFYAPRAVVQDCYFYDCLQAVQTGTEAPGTCVVGNWVQRCWGDDFKITPCPKLRFAWNTTVDKLYGGSGSHGDALQLDGTGNTQDIVGFCIVGNINVRGDGSPGQQDGQNLFLADLPTPYRWVDGLIAGNFGMMTYANSIYVGGINGRVDEVANGCKVFNNTCLQDGTIAQNDATIRMEGLDVGTFQAWNLQAQASVPAGDMSVTRYTGYDTFFVGGQAMQGAGIGSTKTAIVAKIAIKAGSPADTPGALYGAHQSIFDFMTMLINPAALASNVVWPEIPT
jgi:hypothetical protein